MIRFILNRRIIEAGDPNGHAFTSMETLDVDVPELEALLKRGGRGAGSDFTELVGAELDPSLYVSRGDK